MKSLQRLWNENGYKPVKVRRSDWPRDLYIEVLGVFDCHSTLLKTAICRDELFNAKNYDASLKHWELFVEKKRMLAYIVLENFNFTHPCSGSRNKGDLIFVDEELTSCKFQRAPWLDEPV